MGRFDGRITGDVRIGSGGQKHLGHVEIHLGSRPHQRGVTAAISFLAARDDVGLRAQAQEMFDHLGVAVVGGFKERGNSPLVSAIDGHAIAMEFVDQIALALHRGQDHGMMHMFAIGPCFLKPSLQANEVLFLNCGPDFIPRRLLRKSGESAKQGKKGRPKSIRESAAPKEQSQSDESCSRHLVVIDPGAHY